MSNGIVKVETLGSFWEIDDNEKTYRRTPKNGPREFPEWGNELAGPLQDEVLHSFYSWGIQNYQGVDFLIIRSLGWTVSAPQAIESSHA